jgi:hypothetical protein
MLTGHYWESEPANNYSIAADRQTHIWKDVLKGLGIDDNVF